MHAHAARDGRRDGTREAGRDGGRQAGVVCVVAESVHPFLHSYGADAQTDSIATTLHNIASVRKDRGDLDGAEEMFNQSLAMSRHV